MIQDAVLLNDWHAVLPLHQLEAQNGIAPARILGEDIVIWKAGDRVLAWKDLCIHRGTRLSLGKIEGGELLECPYHGWTYDATGACIRIPAHPDQVPPAKAHAITYQARVAYDMVWVCLGEPEHDIAPFGEWNDDGYRRVLCGPYEFHASGPRMVENFLDVAHFPFVHEHILGTRERPEIPDYEVSTDETGVTASDIRVFQPNPDGTGVPKWVTYTYQVHRPLVAYFRKEAEQRFAILLMVTPIEEVQSLMWMWMVMTHGEGTDETLRAFQDEIALQDLPIVESQRPELLPLDLQAELHLRSDKTAIAYRKWLNSIGLTFGTS
jgi:phenylpropionate dioxygenase-like ring-hydroxylating dioxygenase large terminal subunit